VDRTESKAYNLTKKTKFMYLPVGPVGNKTQVRKRLLRAPNLALHSARTNSSTTIAKNNTVLNHFF
jgi:hypothetical protein